MRLSVVASCNKTNDFGTRLQAFSGDFLRSEDALYYGLFEGCREAFLRYLLNSSGVGVLLVGRRF
jgi:hypothetical protein